MNWGRSPDSLCGPCEGSGWVAIVRGRRAVLSQALNFDVEPLAVSSSHA